VLGVRYPFSGRGAWALSRSALRIWRPRSQKAINTTIAKTATATGIMANPSFVSTPMAPSAASAGFVQVGSGGASVLLAMTSVWKVGDTVACWMRMVSSIVVGEELSARASKRCVWDIGLIVSSMSRYRSDIPSPLNQLDRAVMNSRQASVSVGNRAWC
jgi:hypothetical protein